MCAESINDAAGAWTAIAASGSYAQLQPEDAGALLSARVRASVRQGTILLLKRSPAMRLTHRGQIGVRCHIGPFTYIGQDVEIGDDVEIEANATLVNCSIGNHVVLHTGVCIGQVSQLHLLICVAANPAAPLGRLWLRTGERRTARQEAPGLACADPRPRRDRVRCFLYLSVRCDANGLMLWLLYQSELHNRSRQLARHDSRPRLQAGQSGKRCFAVSLSQFSR